MVSIITVNYNGWRDTCDLIGSLKTFETYPFEIIVVDNASDGDDVRRISKAFPDVLLVCSNTNLGFAGGNNLGLQYASGNYIFFLNNDMVVKNSLLEPMVNRLKCNVYAGVSPCIASLYNPERIQYYGYKDMSSITLKHTTESFDPSRRDYFLQPKETEVLHGGAMMIRRDVISKVGVMTEIYFLFYEEFDWSRRIRRAGYKLYFEPNSIVYHKESMTIKPQTYIREYYLTRSRMIYARRNCKSWRKPLACLYQCTAALPKKVFYYMCKKRFDLVVAVLKGTIQGLLYPI